LGRDTRPHRGGGATTGIFHQSAPSGETGVRFLFRVLRARPTYLAGYAIVGTVCLVALFAPLLSRYSPVTAYPQDHLQPPNPRHWLGTDIQGLDIWSRLLYAARIDLAIAVTGTMISAAAGTVAGAFVGYYHGVGGVRGALSETVMRAADVIQAFPVFVLAIALVAVLGQKITNVIYAIAFVNAPIYLRLVRAQTMSLRERCFIEASVICGNPDWVTVFRHIIPNTMGPVFSQMSINAGWAILLTAGLSFVGAGVRPPAPEWGIMIQMGFSNIATGEWWPSVFPGIAITLTVLGFGLIGQSIELLSDPARRRTLVLRGSDIDAVEPTWGLSAGLDGNDGAAMSP
jgi:peptide/nickel transport system permease protein